MSSKRDGIEVAIICALPLEAHAAKALFEGSNEDLEDTNIGKAATDTNIYTAGRIGSHNVVIVHMPGMGKIPAATVAENLKQSFTKIKLALLIGICGGVPEQEQAPNLTLGDVIIGKEVVHYDFGRQHENGFKRKNKPEDGLGWQPREIRAFIKKLESGKPALEKKAAEYLPNVLKFCGLRDTSGLQDSLYLNDYWHFHKDRNNCSAGQRCDNGEEICDTALNSSCEQLKCDKDELVRPSDPKPNPNIHFGAMASGDTVMKSATIRDTIAKEERVIGFDMEAAGVWDYLPCVVIKGVCDYADSHKNKTWQVYAAATAAACTKAALGEWNQKDQPSGRQARVRTVFNNYNSKIVNQADRLTIHGGQHFSF
ncbi:hypothetical protein AA313_de0203916 [Arthrobotrys entomopaga]|nr:hypothetical protein AA313_de0203916 [Arthrobotrys entomopaga]